MAMRSSFFWTMKSCLVTPLLVDAAQSCQEIYPSKTEESVEDKVAESALDRSTYIQFSVGTFSFAIDISKVSEIISTP